MAYRSDVLEFVVGETYSNRARQYTVLEIRGPELVVRFDDGSTGTLDAEAQRRIITNMRRELDQLAGAYAGLSREQKEKFFWSIGFLAARADLQAELPTKAVGQFQEKYRQTTGMPINTGTPGFYVLQDPVDKWGPELRVYFNATSQQLRRIYFGQNIEIRDGHYVGQYRINNNDFFIKLLGLGFILGPRQELQRIRQHVPPDIRDVFERGIRGQ